mgnify:CR=1 FL=1
MFTLTLTFAGVVAIAPLRAHALAQGAFQLFGDRQQHGLKAPTLVRERHRGAIQPVALQQGRNQMAMNDGAVDVAAAEPVAETLTPILMSASAATEPNSAKAASSGLREKFFMQVS